MKLESQAHVLFFLVTWQYLSVKAQMHINFDLEIQYLGTYPDTQLQACRNATLQYYLKYQNTGSNPNVYQ